MKIHQHLNLALTSKNLIRNKLKNVYHRNIFDFKFAWLKNKNY